MSSSSSAGSSSKLARSASAIVASASRGYHILKIDGYSRTKAKPTGKCIKSHTFTQSAITAGRSATFLNESVTKPLKVQYDFRFIDEVEEEAPSLLSEEIVTNDSHGSWGYARFIKREALERSKHLKDDSFMVRCDVAVITIHKFRTEELAKVPTTTFVSLPPPSGLHGHLGDLLRTEKGADMVFQVSGETFKAHGCVLATRSPVFSAELIGQMKESNVAAGVVHIDDMEAHVFKALLLFIYTDSTPMMRKEEEAAMFKHLLVAADKLVCAHKLCNCIKATTLATILALAEQHHCHGLKKACFNFLSSPVNLAAVLASDGFEHLNRSCPSVIKKLVAKLGT